MSKLKKRCASLLNETHSVLFAVFAERLYNAQHGGFLLWRQEDPSVKQLFQFRAELHHIVFREELSGRNAKTAADRFQRGNRRGGVPLEYILDRRFR